MSDEDMSDVVFVGAHGVGKTTLMYSLATLCSIGNWPIICHRAPVPPPIQLFLPQGDEPVLTTRVRDYGRGGGEEEKRELTLPSILSDFLYHDPADEDEIGIRDENGIRIKSTHPYKLCTWKFRYSSAEGQNRSIETIDVAGLIWSMLFWEVNLDSKWDITELRKKWDTYNKTKIESIRDEVIRRFPDLKNLPAATDENTLMAMKEVIKSVLTKLENARIVGIVGDISRFMKTPSSGDGWAKCWASNIQLPLQLIWTLSRSNKKVIFILNKLDKLKDLSELDEYMRGIPGASQEDQDQEDQEYIDPKLRFVAYFHNMGYDVLSNLIKVLENNHIISGMLSNGIRDKFAKPLKELNGILLESNEERVKEYLRNLKLAMIPIAARVKQNNDIHTIFIEDLLQLIEVMRSNT